MAAHFGLEEGVCVRNGKAESYRVNIKRYPWLYAIAFPVVLFYVVYCYLPMYGVIIAFQNYSPARGILGSKWVGLKHFISFFTGRYFFRLVSNTLLINVKLLMFGFPLPIIFAILLNEIHSSGFRRITQTITYMPHFVSSVVVCGLLKDFTKSGGLLTSIAMAFGGENVNLLSKAKLFQPLFVGMNIWQQFGWDSIIFFAAMSSIDPVLYEATRVDGANRFQQVLHVTLPGLFPTIVVILILRIGRLMSLGWEQIVLLYSPLVYETSDVISTYVYRRGLLEFEYSFGTAVGLFNSLINIILLISANALSRMVNETSLW